MARQHAAPVLLPTANQGAIQLAQIAGHTGRGAISEAEIQSLVHEHPSILPIDEIDPAFGEPISICRELRTPAGSIDIFLVTPKGLPVLVECKLWRNPQSRREVIGQILDYAKELSRWTQSDLQREVNVRLGTTGNVLWEKVRPFTPDEDESAFNDSLSSNLRRGRFLLLIVGDGIREGVEAITEYLQQHAGLHFSFGLVEIPFFALPDGSRLALPRVLARTLNIVRNVILVPDGTMLEEGDAAAPETDDTTDEMGTSRLRFWHDFLDILRLDDPEQRVPRAARAGHISFMFPAPNGSSWLTVYRDIRRNEIGVMLSATRDSAGEYAAQRVAEDWDSVGRLLNATAHVVQDRYGRPQIRDHRICGDLELPTARQEALTWLAERVNTFVNVLRPRIRSAVADYMERDMM